MKTKTISIEKIYNIFKKYGDLNIQVNTPVGFKKINWCDITAKNSKVYEITTEYNKKIKVSPEHRFKSKNGRWVYAKNLITGNSYIKTIDGSELIKSIHILPYKDDLYDIEVDEVHQYYSNGILSHNSSAIDILSFSLFDKGSRDSKPLNILNRSKKWFKTEVSFSIGTDTFYIVREVKLPKSERTYVKYKVNFWKEGPDGEEINLNGENRWETNKNILSYIGTFEDFILTTFSVQNKNSGFIEKGNTERKDLIIQFMGLNIFDRLYDEANIKYRELQTVLKEKSKINYSDVIASYKSNIEKLTKEYDDISKIINEYKLKSNSYDKEIDSLKSLLKPVSVHNLNESDLISSKENLTLEMNKMIKKSESIITIINELNDDRDDLMGKLGSYSIDKIISDENLLSKFNSEYINIKHKIKLLEKDISNAESKMDKLKDLEYDKNCNFCMNNVFVKDAIETKDTLNTLYLNLDNLNNELKDIKTKIDNINVLELREKYDELQKQISETNTQLHTNEKLLLEINAKQSRVESELKDINASLDLYYKNETNIKDNEKINSHIESVNTKNLLIKTELNKLNNKSIDLYSDLKINKLKLVDTEGELESYNKLQSLTNSYNIYLDSIKRDGIPHTLIKKSLPLIESEVNNILSQIIDFSILFDLDENKNINLFIVYNENQYWSMELASGMEKFISSIAIRVALTSISNLPRSPFLIIDEGWGNLDEENLNWVSVLLSYLKSQFDYILTISHIEHLQDVSDSSLDISKVGGFSKIWFE